MEAIGYITLAERKMKATRELIQPEEEASSLSGSEREAIQCTLPVTLEERKTKATEEESSLSGSDRETLMIGNMNLLHTLNRMNVGVIMILAHHPPSAKMHYK